MPDTDVGTDTVRLQRGELAKLLGVRPEAVSKAAHKKYYCSGYSIWEWAEWHPRGNQVQAYKVPKWAIKEMADPEEWPKYDIFDGLDSTDL